MMNNKYVIGISPLVADTVYHKIHSELNKSGYDMRYEGDVEKIAKDNQITQYQQKFKLVSCWSDDKEKQYFFSEKTPLLTISLMGYKNEFDKIIYILSANIPSNIFYWEGEDESLLHILSDVFIEDAKSDILNALASNDLIVKEYNRDSGYIMYENKIKKYTNKLYEGLLKQIKESLDEGKDVSLDELDEKIDIIMDALGLKTEDEEQNEEKIDIDTEVFDINNDNKDDVMFTDIDTEEDIEETEGENE